MSLAIATVTIVTRKVTGAWRVYLKMLDKHPLRTHALTTSLIMGGGDCIAQLAVERRSWLKHDKLRTSRFLGSGLLVFGPAMHVWYDWLDKVIKGTARARVIKKLGADQLFFLPLYLGVFFVIMSALRRDTLKETRHHLERDYWPCLKASYELWPAVQIFNFYFVPTHHRVLVINFVSLLWTTYLAYKSEQND